MKNQEMKKLLWVLFLIATIPLAISTVGLFLEYGLLGQSFLLLIIWVIGLIFTYLQKRYFRPLVIIASVWYLISLIIDFGKTPGVNVWEKLIFYTDVFSILLDKEKYLVLIMFVMKLFIIPITLILIIGIVAQINSSDNE